MTPILSGWSFAYTSDGLVLHPSDRASGAVRVRSRQAPLRTLRSIVDERIQELDVTGVRIAAFDSLTTHEGNYAAIVSLRATDLDAETPIALVYAAAYGDDFYTELSAIAHGPVFELVEKAVRDLTYHASLGLGENRRRWFHYDPPPAWTPYPRELTTEWIPPLFPSDLAMIAVHPVRPLRERPSTAIDHALNELSWYGFEHTVVDDPRPIRSAYGLDGVRWRAIGAYRGEADTYIDIARYEDDRYSYLVTMRSAGGAHAGIFETLYTSARPVPHPERCAPDLALGHWLEL